MVMSLKFDSDGFDQSCANEYEIEHRNWFTKQKK